MVKTKVKIVLKAKVPPSVATVGVCVGSPLILWKVVPTKSPYQGVHRGFRIRVAWPNMAGHKAFSSEIAPSFRFPYLMLETSDFNQEDTTIVQKGVRDYLKTKGLHDIVDPEEYMIRLGLFVDEGNMKAVRHG